MCAAQTMIGDAHFSEMYAMDWDLDSVLISHMGEGNWKIARTDRPIRLIDRPLGIGRLDNPPTPVFSAVPAAQREIPLLGTPHADLCAHPIPVTRALTEAEIATDYEDATGQVLVDAIAERGPVELPCALVRGHAPFCWGTSPKQAVEVAVTLEEVARMTMLTMLLEPGVQALDSPVRDKHYGRKHGPQAYYGQP